MNHKNTTLAIAAIIAVLGMTAVAFAVPQQALASKHHHNNNGIKVDQQINQLNQCTGVRLETTSTLVAPPPPPRTVCLNLADNSADIHK